MKKEQLLQKVARLEFANDQLIAELDYLDKLMRQVGFSDGLNSLKITAKELYDNNGEEDKHNAA